MLTNTPAARAFFNPQIRARHMTKAALLRFFMFTNCD
jgi:hypothetical protein